MLAIVEHDENATISDGRGDFVDRIIFQTKIEAESGGGGSRNLCPVLDRGKVYKGNRVERRAQAVRHGNGHSCLADAAWADHRQ
jgi:hypothetical protein